MASPILLGGARSASAAIEATKKAASATPSSRRSTITSPRLSAYAVPSIPTALISAPPTSNGRRPLVSASRPAMGRRSSAETAKAPNASPAPDLSEPTGPVTQSGRV